MRIGAHLESTDPLAAAADRKAEVVQFFLTDPQAWAEPQPRADAAALQASEIDVFIHAPYRINVASLNNRIRIPSRKLLMAHATGAAEVGARGLIVHGGHVDTPDDVGFCLDTCHAHAGGEDLLDIVDRVKAITGRIDLIHANNSRDPFDSGRDRH